MSIQFHNYSSVIGGQEIFLRSLISSLCHKYELSYIGNDPFLVKFQNCTQPVQLQFFNGNRALYSTIFKRKKCKWIGIQHSLLEDGQSGFFKKIVRKFLYYIILLRIDTMVQVSDRCFDKFSNNAKIITIRNGVNISNSKTSILKSKVPIVLMVGALTKNKNHRSVIKAFSSIDNGQLVIVGDGPEEKDLRELAQRLGLSKTIKFTGNKSDVSEFYQKADIFINASEYEACSLSVIEAMSFGIPIILSNTGESENIINNFQSGLLLDDRLSSAEISDCINVILQNKTLKQKFSDNAKECVHSSYSFNAMVRAYENLIKGSI